ncbi:MAG TPA: hypothetical protein VGK34_07590 [Armatimonadota bacterium]
MRMTREAYAREVWKVVESVRDGRDEVACPHDSCKQALKVLVASVQAGTTIVCPDHGIIYRE